MKRAPLWLGIIALVAIAAYGWNRQQQKSAAVAPRQAGSAIARLNGAMTMGNVGEVKRIIGAHREFLDSSDWMSSPSVLRHPDLVRYLLSAGLSPDGQRNDGTPLLMCGTIGEMEAAERLLHDGAEVEARDGRGQTVLMRASAAGWVDLCKALLNQGAHVNATIPEPKGAAAQEPLTEGRQQDTTALHMAARAGHTEVAVYLLKHGADPSIRNRAHETAIEIAKRLGHKDCAQQMAQWIAGKSGAAKP